MDTRFGPSYIESERHAEVATPFTNRRLISFLTLHLLGFAASVAAMVNFILTTDYYFFFCIFLPFLFSGAFCAHAAWHCDAPALGLRCLPLKRWPLPVALLLTVPFGFAQGVIVMLAVEEFAASKSPERLMLPGRHGVNKFHCKAVNGVFEGVLSSSVLLYSFWSLGYPEDAPITQVSWVWTAAGESTFLAGLGIVAFFLSGLGVMELDFCTSRTIAKRMHRSANYEAVHWLFRTSEVMSRVSLFIGFMVNTRQRLSWWWAPLAVEFGTTLALVAVFGGAETWLVRILCSIPCSFANIFLFIDSPYKRRAAARLSRCLTAKHALETLLLPLLLVVCVPDIMRDLRDFWKKHPATNISSIIAFPLFWVLLWCLHSPGVGDGRIADIFSACESGSVSAVRSALRDLTKSAAVGLNINCFDVEGKTPLMFAAAKGHDNVCRLLLQEGARAEVRVFRPSRGRLCGGSFRTCCLLPVRRRWTALHIAAWKGHAKAVQALLEGGSGAGHMPHDAMDAGAATAGPPTAAAFKDALDETPLHVAAWSGHEEAARLLALAHPEWVEARNSRGQTAVELAHAESVRRTILVADTSSTPLWLQQGLSGSVTGRPFSRSQQDAAWPKVQLFIVRSSEDGNMAAPGLCSYIACSCGGALGRVFLRAAEEEASIVRLPSISEAEDESESVASLALLPQGHPALSAASSLLGTPRAATTGGSSLAPHMVDLEPISAAGDSVGLHLLLEPTVGGASIHRGTTAERQAPRRVCCCICERGPLPRSVSSQAVVPLAYTVDSRRFQHIPEEAVLGEGAYGLVWRAKDRRTQSWYAVKNISTLRRGNSAIATRECEVADHIRLQPHPCLVHLYHVHHFADAALYSLVMEFCPGGDVLSAIRRQRQTAMADGVHYTPPEPARRWVAEVFLGLEHLHLRMRTLLRDLKPENVVLSAAGCAKLTDFGFGRFGVESCGQWSFGIPTGSPGYVAPEILKMQEYDYRVDLYSYGVLVWVLLTGGITTSAEPVPPMQQMRHRGDFDAHLQDWLLLAHCISEPERHAALPLEQDGRDFVGRLVQQQPTDRFCHGEIRQHAFIQPLRVPAFDASPEEVKAWLSGAQPEASEAPTPEAQSEALEPAASDPS